MGSRIAEFNIDVVVHLARVLKGMLDEYLTELLSLIFGSDAKRSEGKDLLSLTVSSSGHALVFITLPIISPSFSRTKASSEIKSGWLRARSKRL